MAPPAADSKARKINDSIWIFSRPFKRFGFLPLGGRSVAVKLSNGTLWVLASTPLDTTTSNTLKEFGEVAYVVSPNSDHHFFLTDYMAAFPSAKLVGPAPLAEKRTDLKFTGLYTKDAPETVYGFEEDITAIPFAGTALTDIAFYHKHTKTLIVGDLIFNLPNNESMPGGLNFLWKAFSPGGSVHGKLIAGSIKDKALVEKDAKAVDALDFSTIIPLHGDVIDQDAKAKWKLAYHGII